MNAVEIHDVTKTFGSVTAVRELSLTVPSGVVYGFIGPNGSGKTTTLRMIMRIHLPDLGQGTIRVLGEETSRCASDRVGYLPEERGLYKKMRIRELLRFYAELKGRRDRPAIRRDIDAWLDRLSLLDRGNDKVETLSKGMSQKVQFIAAVIARPELLILDEPFSGLDPVNRESMRDALMDMRKGGATVIFSTHEMDVAEKMCDAIFMIFRGQKVLDGTLESIQDRYGSDTIRLRLDGDGVDLERLPGVQRVNDYGRFQELRIDPGADAQAILAAVMSKARVRHFELGKPSLNDIFIRIAGPAGAEGTDHAP